MGLLRDVTIGAIGGAVGYHYGEKQAIKKKTKGLNPDPPLRCIIEDYAKAHHVYGRANWLFHEFVNIAELYHDPYNE